MILIQTNEKLEKSHPNYVLKFGEIFIIIIKAYITGGETRRWFCHIIITNWENDGIKHKKFQF